MSNSLVQRKKSEREQEIVLRLFEHIEVDRSISQTRFANEIGIAKGHANVCFNCCIKKGWIKLKQAPKQRYFYYVTAKGHAEKARLTLRFLACSLQFYCDIKEDMVRTMESARAEGHKRLAVIGDGELAEIAAIVAEQAAVKLVGCLSRSDRRKRIVQLPVVMEWGELDRPEAAFLATLEKTKEAHDTFRAAKPELALYVPKCLKALIW